MQKSIKYKISSFAEKGGISIFNIYNIIESSKKTSWKTKADFAVLEIEFEPTDLFEAKICIRYLGTLTPIILKVSTDSGMSYEKQYDLKSKSRNLTISKKKLKFPTHSFEINRLRFEFTKIDECIEIKHLLLQVPKESNKKILSSPKPKSFKQSLIEKSLKSSKEPKKSETSLLELQDSDIRNHFSQQERLTNLFNEEKSKTKYNTRSTSQELSLTNSYAGLLKELVVCVLVEDEVIRSTVIDLLSIFGAVYVEEFSDFCNLVVSEKISGLEGVPEVTVRWLFDCAARREKLPFEMYNK